MLVAGLLFSAMGVLVKLGAREFSAAELVFYRSLFGFAMILPAVLKQRGFLTPWCAGICREVCWARRASSCIFWSCKFSSCKFSCDPNGGSGECDEPHSAGSMGWMRSMIEPYAANPRHHRKIYRTS